MKQDDEMGLSVSDWLSFLETRSSNYISAVSVGASAVAIVISLLGLKTEFHWIKILAALIFALLVLQWLTSRVIGSSFLVEFVEAKRISDGITEGELKSLGEIEEEWRNREKNLGSWLKRKLNYHT